MIWQQQIADVDVNATTEDADVDAAAATAADVILSGLF